MNSTPKGVEALFRRSPVLIERETRREARLAAAAGVPLAPVLALAILHAVRSGRRSVTLADFDAAVLARYAPPLVLGSESL
jgi:hypothetical protein